MRVRNIKWKRSARPSDRAVARISLGPCEIVPGRVNGEPGIDPFRCTYWVILYEEDM